MTPHAEMTLREYVRTVLPEVKPDIRRYYHRELTKAVDQFCDMLGEDIAVGDVTPDMLAEFAGARTGNGLSSGCALSCGHLPRLSFASVATVVDGGSNWIAVTARNFCWRTST